MYSTHLARNTLSLRNVQRARKRLPRMFCAHCAPEPTPSPSQEGSTTGWPVPLLGGVRGGLVAGRFMGRRDSVNAAQKFVAKLEKSRPVFGMNFRDKIIAPDDLRAWREGLRAVGKQLV